MNQRRSIPWWIWPILVLLLLFVITVTSQGQEGTPGEEAAAELAEDQPMPPFVRGVLSPTQESALERLRADSTKSPSVSVKNGILRFASMEVIISDSVAVGSEAKARYFLNSYADLFDIADPDNEFSISEQTQNNLTGDVHIRLKQLLNGLPVLGSELVVSTDLNGAILSVKGGYVPKGGQQISSFVPTITAAEVKGLAENNVLGSAMVGQPNLVIYDSRVFGETGDGSHLAWEVELLLPDGLGSWLYVIDANDGSILVELPLDQTNLFEIYDIQNSTVLTSAVLAYTDTSTTPYDDAEATGARDFMRETVGYFSGFGRRGYDGRGRILRAYVHYGQDYGASYLPAERPEDRILRFGDGFVSSDVVGHEFTHGVIHTTSNLVYRGESGALNESYADIYGTLIDGGQELVDDWWLLGEGALGPMTRNMQDPTLGGSYDPRIRGSGQPDHYSNRASSSDAVCRSADGRTGDDCVHTNSGIQNRAAYLLIQEGEEIVGEIEVEGIGPEKVSRIFLSAVYALIGSADFEMARDVAIEECERFVRRQLNVSFGDCRQIQNAYAAVGVGDPAFLSPIADPSDPYIVPESSTVLILDTSGSMRNVDIIGDTKIAAARRAGENIVDIVAAENEGQEGVANQIGIVSFNNEARIDRVLSADLTPARSALRSMVADGGTGMPDGLQQGIRLLAQDTSGGRPIMILLSDGMANIGHGGDQNMDIDEVKEQVRELARESNQRGYCLYTVGFGIPSPTAPASGDQSLDEQLLREISRIAGCGEYYNAQNATELANVYVDIRHESTGNVQLNQSGNIAQGQTLDIGQVPVPRNQSMMLFTLNWPGSQLDPLVTDPRGRSVDANYRDASIATKSSIAMVIVNEPRSGTWQVGANGTDVPGGTTTYHAVVSTREALGIPLSKAPLWFMLGGLGLVGGALWMNSRRTTGWYLDVKKKEGEKYRVKVGRKGVWIGRDPQCAIHLDDPAVSRRHAWIGPSARDKDELFLRDEESQMGTKRNGKKIHQAGLKEEDEVTIGETQIRPLRGKSA